MTVRRATMQDVPAVSGAMARAFGSDDPLFDWMLPDDATRVAKITAMNVATLPKFLSIDTFEIYTTDDHAGLAMWAGPEQWDPPIRAMLTTVPSLLRNVGIGAMARMNRSLGALKRAHPRQPHWYLMGLGTDPPKQGKGVGTALINEMLVRCDAELLPAYLETQKPANVPYYEKFGFSVTGEIDIPGGGPHMWLMWRDPR
jgi:ribosomal protein S18 acetylase RimI-like enzyme